MEKSSWNPGHAGILNGRLGSYPLTIGKAVKGDPVIAQPEASELGLVPKVAFRFMVSGPSNSGKTNLCRYMLDKYYVKAPGQSFFDRIYLFSPTAKLDPVWKDLEGLRPSDRITELDASGTARLSEVFDNGLRRTKAMGKDRAPHELIIFDDAIASTKFLNSEYFLKVFVAGRHGNLSCMVLTQSYIKVPRSVRMQVTGLFMFPSRVTEIIRLAEEHGPISMSTSDFIEMVKYAITKTETEKYPFFMIDTNQPEESRFRRCLNEVLIPTSSSASSSSNGDPALATEGRQVDLPTPTADQKRPAHTGAHPTAAETHPPPDQKRSGKRAAEANPPSSQPAKRRWQSFHRWKKKAP